MPANYGIFPLDITPHANANLMGEDYEHPRKYWVNRKEDRFTVSVSFMRSGTTATGKKWYKWLQAYAVSVSIKTNYSGQKRVNAYFSELRGSRSYLMNITTKPSEILFPVSEPVMVEIIKETVELAKRQGMLTAYQEGKTSYLPSKAIFSELILSLAYPMVSTTLSEGSNKFKVDSELGVPQFATQLLRMSDSYAMSKYLKLGANSTEAFRNALGLITLNELYILDLIRGFADDETQELIITNAINNKSTYDMASWNYYEKALYSPQVRKLFKTVQKESLQSLLRDSTLFISLERVLERWVGLSRPERRIKLSKGTPTALSFVDSITAAISNSKEELAVEAHSINAFFAQINNGKSVTCMQKVASVRFGNSSLAIPASISEDDKLGRVILALPFNNSINKKSHLWAKAISNPTFVDNKMEIVGYQKNGYIPITSPSLCSFTPKHYLEFLNSILDEADLYLAKYSIDKTVDSRAFAFSIVLHFMTNARLSANSQMPTKIWKMYKDGFTSELIYQALTLKIPYNRFKEYAGIPTSWVQKVLGLEEKNNSFFF
jgi:hypothetical protein